MGVSSCILDLDEIRQIKLMRERELAARAPKLISDILHEEHKGRELDLTIPEQHTVFARSSMCCLCSLQLAGKRYPLKAIRTLEKKEKKEYFLQTKPKAISVTDSTFCARCSVCPVGSLQKGRVITRETLA